MKRKQVQKFEVVSPTKEQMDRAGYAVERDTKAGQVTGERYRRIRQLELLADLFRKDEYEALYKYRYNADLCDKSLLRDSLAQFMPRGNALDLPAYILDAKRIAEDCERAAGSLADILRAVILNDVSLGEWAMEKGGAIDDCRTVNGQKICRIRPRQLALDTARLEIKIVAGRVQSEFDA